MRGGRLILMAAGLWTAAASAEQVQTAKETHEVRVLVERYAKCVVREHHDEAKSVLMSDSDNNDILRHHSTVIDSNCMTEVGGAVAVTFPQDMYRYGLADALVRADFLKKGVESFSDRLPLAHLPMPTQADLDRSLSGIKSARRKRELEESYRKDRGIAALSIYGECIARTDPVGARLWILTEPDVPEEASRTKVLMPAFQQCMQPGATVKFSKDQLRGVVALNYYRLANATPQHGLGGEH